MKESDDKERDGHFARSESLVAPLWSNVAMTPASFFFLSQGYDCFCNPQLLWAVYVCVCVLAAQKAYKDSRYMEKQKQMSEFKSKIHHWTAQHLIFPSLKGLSVDEVWSRDLFS